MKFLLNAHKKPQKEDHTEGTVDERCGGDGSRGFVSS